MCYTATSLTLKALKYARHRGDIHHADELARKLHDLDPLKFPLYNVSGFAHPKLLVFTSEAPMQPQFYTWGLIPYWTKSLADAKKTWNQTLNARGETVFEKPAFRNSAAEMGPRMPVIIPAERQDEWLIDCKTENDKKHLIDLIKPFDQEQMFAHTVGKIKVRTRSEIRRRRKRNLFMRISH